MAIQHRKVEIRVRLKHPVMETAERELNRLLHRILTVRFPTQLSHKRRFVYNHLQQSVCEFRALGLRVQGCKKLLQELVWMVFNGYLGPMAYAGGRL